MGWRCLDCKARFDELEMVVLTEMPVELDGISIGFEPECIYVCPYCRSTDIEAE